MPTTKKPTQKKPAAKKTAPKKAVLKKVPVKSAQKTTQAPVRAQQLIKAIRSKRFAIVYLIVSLLVLFATTITWALLSAHVQQSNADQLANSYLFGSASIFHHATMPGQHAFLLKWPVFLVISLLGYTNHAFATLTVVLVLLTVGLFAGILYQIERRPLVFGTICLAMASVLLLVPTQPYPGGLLPVNMAMLATRNIEYIAYIFGLLLLIRSPGFRSRTFWLAVGLLGLLIASDKLFLTLSLGAAFLSLVTYAATQRWNYVTMAVRWLLASIVAIALGLGLLAAIAASGATNITSQAGTGPYGLAHSAHIIILNGVYAVLGIFTNFGANPAFTTTLFRQIPHDSIKHLFSLGGPTFIINFCLLAVALFATYQVLKGTLVGPKRTARPDEAIQLSIMLLATAIAALGAYVVSAHYAAADARYLGISFFALFVVGATYARRLKWQPERLLLIGAILCLGIAIGIPTMVHANHADTAVLAATDQRNQLVEKALEQHPVDVLVGDYWRVLPIKQQTKGALPVTPLSGCTQAREVLSSNTAPSLKSHSFAYLLTLEGSLTDFPNCTLKQVTDAYGRPNSSILIDGTLANPKELLLFYDLGANLSAPKLAQPTKIPATVLPIPIDQLPNTACLRPTTMNIVAHQDDDLLFMNPDLIHSIADQHCIRTVYLTAGDDGSGSYYWLSREKGAEAAYSRLLGSNAIWVERIVELSNHEFMTVANPRGNPNISLIFLHLPDGNLTGDGFAASKHESLAKLKSGAINQLQSIDGQSTFSRQDLVDALANIMLAYKPSDIRTQANVPSDRYPDHSDHITTGMFATDAYRQYEQQQYDNKVTIPITYYIGYPIHALDENVSGTDLQQKQAAFFAYAKYDHGACTSMQDCQKSHTYDYYLSRQYAQ